MGSVHIASVMQCKLKKPIYANALLQRAGPREQPFPLTSGAGGEDGFLTRPMALSQPVWAGRGKGASRSSTTGKGHRGPPPPALQQSRG